MNIFQKTAYKIGILSTLFLHAYTFYLYLRSEF